MRAQSSRTSNKPPATLVPSGPHLPRLLEPRPPHYQDRGLLSEQEDTGQEDLFDLMGVPAHWIEP